MHGDSDNTHITAVTMCMVMVVAVMCFNGDGDGVGDHSDERMVTVIAVICVW